MPGERAVREEPGVQEERGVPVCNVLVPLAAAALRPPVVAHRVGVHLRGAHRVEAHRVEVRADAAPMLRADAVVRLAPPIADAHRRLHPAVNAGSVRTVRPTRSRGVGLASRARAATTVATTPAPVRSGRRCAPSANADVTPRTAPRAGLAPPRRPPSGAGAAPGRLTSSRRSVGSRAATVTGSCVS